MPYEAPGLHGHFYFCNQRGATNHAEPQPLPWNRAGLHPDPIDEPRREILCDTQRARRHQGREALDPETLTVASVFFVPTAKLQRLTMMAPQKGADDGDGLATVGRRHVSHTERAVFALEHVAVEKNPEDGII